MPTEKPRACDPYELWVPGPAPNDSATIAARVDSATKGRVAYAVASGRFLFNNESDLVRAAVHRFLCDAVAPHLETVFQDDIKLSKQLIRQLQMVARVNHVALFCHEVRTATLRMLEHNARESAVSAYVSAEQFIESTSEPFRSQVLRYMRESAELADVRALVETREPVTR